MGGRSTRSRRIDRDRPRFHQISEGHLSLGNRMVRETHLTPDDLILPMFVCPGRGVKKAVESMPGVAQMSVDNVVAEARDTWAAGVPAVILFGIPDKKDVRASGAYARNGIVQQAVRLLKKELPELLVITDVCLCEYMAHGHCGVVHAGKGGAIAAFLSVRRVPTPELAVGRIDLEWACFAASLSSQSHHCVDA